MPHLTVAQNIFIGREPRRAGFFISERRLNAHARELIERLHLPLAPKQLVGSLTVAKQQMVEIAKALSYDAEAADHGRAHRGAERRRGGGPARPDPPLRPPRHGRHLHLAPHGRAPRIADRITVIRDGRYVGTRETAETSMNEVISMMVGRELSRRGAAGRRRGGPRGGARGLGAATKDAAQRRRASSCARARSSASPGLMGAGRTEVARALVGADKTDAGTIPLRGREITSATRPRPPGTGSATCPRTASSSACCSSRRSTRTSG